MGTSCRIFIRHKGNFVLGQYSAMDGYIDGQGIYLLNFLRSHRNILRLKQGLEHIEYTTDRKATEWKWNIDQKLHRNEVLETAWSSFCYDVSACLPRELQEMNPSVHPRTGAAILKLISDSTAKQKVQLVKELRCPNSFDEDWYYVVDLDESRLEVYHGLEIQHPDHMFFNHYLNQRWVPRLDCAYTFAALEGLSEKEFIEYHKGSRKNGPTLEFTRSLFRSRIEKKWRQKSRQTNSGRKKTLLRRLLAKRNGGGQKK